MKDLAKRLLGVGILLFSTLNLAAYQLTAYVPDEIDPAKRWMVDFSTAKLRFWPIIGNGTAPLAMVDVTAQAGPWQPASQVPPQTWLQSAWLQWQVSLPANNFQAPLLLVKRQSEWQTITIDDQTPAWQYAGEWLICPLPIGQKPMTLAIAHRLGMYAEPIAWVAEAEAYNRWANSLPYGVDHVGALRNVTDIAIAQADSTGKAITQFSDPIRQSKLPMSGQAIIRFQLPAQGPGRADLADPVLTFSLFGIRGFRLHYEGQLIHSWASLELTSGQNRRFLNDNLLIGLVQLKSTELTGTYDLLLDYQGGLQLGNLNVGSMGPTIYAFEAFFRNQTIIGLGPVLLCLIVSVLALSMALVRRRQGSAGLFDLAAMFLLTAIAIVPPHYLVYFLGVHFGLNLMCLAICAVAFFLTRFYRHFEMVPRPWFSSWLKIQQWCLVFVASVLFVVTLIAYLNQDVLFLMLQYQDLLIVFSIAYLVLCTLLLTIHSMQLKAKGIEVKLIFILVCEILFSSAFLYLIVPYTGLINLKSDDLALLSALAMVSYVLTLACIPLAVFMRQERHLRLQNLELKSTNSVFHRFVPQEFLENIGITRIADITLGRHAERELVIMFCDIRSFTRLAENMTPQEVFDFINAYLHRISPIIRDFGGFIDKVIGDGVMAIFPSQPDLAVRAALRIQDEMADWSHERVLAGLSPVLVGAGLHYGPVMMGTIGHRERLSGTVLSDTVNTAARLEGLCKRYTVPVLVSLNLVRAMGRQADLSVQFQDRVRVLGRQEALTIYRVFANELPADRQQRQIEDRQYFAAWRQLAQGRVPTLSHDHPQTGRWLTLSQRLARLSLEGIPKGYDGIDSLDSK